MSHLPKIQCYGKIEAWVLKLEPNDFRDEQNVKHLKRLFRGIRHYHDAWVLTAFYLCTMQTNESHIAFLECVDMELNDNATWSDMLL